MLSPSPSSAAAEVGDRHPEDFATGEAGPGVHRATTSRGAEVILAPTVAGEFADGVPAGWFVEPWKEGGRAEADGGALRLDAATVGNQSLFGSERSLEFAATFGKRPHQHVGFGTNFRTVPWITFSTKFGNSLYARTNFIIPEDTRLSASLLGSPHRFRIEWRVIDVEFWVDGRRVAHQLVPVVGYMRPLASNGSVGGDTLAIEWMRMSPYAPEGTFTSRVYDAGGPAVWEAGDVDADVSEDTSLEVEMRGGDTAQPDEGWSVWAAMWPTSEAPAVPPAPVPGRYAQYRARLATDNPGRTPIVRAVTLRYSSSGPG